MMILELNAAVGDMLSTNTDRMFQETQIDYAQERKSVLSMARTFGLKIPGKRPSVTIVDFSITVPVFGDSFDITYAPVIKAGSQVSGAGKVFETSDDIDFANPFTKGGIPNRLIIPNLDNNGRIANYTLTKREIMVLEVLLNGNSYKSIAIYLNISVDTARKHISRIYKKLKIHSKGELYSKHFNIECKSKHYEHFFLKHINQLSI